MLRARNKDITSFILKLNDVIYTRYSVYLLWCHGAIDVIGDIDVIGVIGVIGVLDVIDVIGVIGVIDVIGVIGVLDVIGVMVL